MWKWSKYPQYCSHFQTHACFIKVSHLVGVNSMTIWRICMAKWLKCVKWGPIPYFCQLPHQILEKIRLLLKRLGSSVVSLTPTNVIMFCTYSCYFTLGALHLPEKMPFTHISQNVSKSLSNVVAVHRTTTVCFGSLTRNSLLQGS